MDVRRIVVIWLVGVLVVGGCGSPAGQAPGTATPGGSSASAAPPPPAAGSTPDPLSLPPFPSVDATPLPDSGIELRVVNLWASPSGPSPTLEIATGSDRAALLSVAPGEVSAFVPLPAGPAGGSPASLVVRDAARPDDRLLSFGLVGTAERITVAIFVTASAGAESGSWFEVSAAFPEWPAVEPDAGTLLVYAGGLGGIPDVLSNLIRDEGQIALALADGRCLQEPLFGRDEIVELGGTLTEYFVLPNGTHELVAGVRTGRCSRDPVTARLMVDLQPGARQVIFPWGASWESLRLLAVPVA